MTRPIRIGVLPHCGNALDFATWRRAVLRAEELGADFIFGYDHFHKPEVADLNQGIPVLADVQPDVTEIDPDPTTGYYDFSTLEEMLAWRDRRN